MDEQTKSVCIEKEGDVGAYDSLLRCQTECAN